jgi:N6-adenosine-specific RNA methylase IME4
MPGKMIEKPTKKYSTILADPPWDINQKGNYGAVKIYPLMKLDDIKAMPISELTEDNAHCWLWVTSGTLEHGFDVLRAWGFTPRSVFYWIKPGLGLGVYLRNCVEPCILGTRGKAPVLFKAQPNWGFFPRQSHSHKPEEMHKIIERVSPGPNRLELFARRPYAGWDVWGDEISSSIDIEGYPVPDSPKTRGETCI